MSKRTMQALTSKNKRWTLPAPLIAIADEHKYVLRLITILEDEARTLAEGEPADFECMADILNYITHYPDRYHHPKEELIFDRMVDADAKIQKILKTLRRDHGRVATMGQGITDAIEEVKKSSSKKKRCDLAKTIETYTLRLREHINLEETQIFVPAATLLSKADWKAIDKEIKPILDPIFGEKKSEEFMSLFGRYITHAASVSTGAISPKLVEMTASSLERMIYATGELSRLPKRLFSHIKDGAKEQYSLLRKMASSRDLNSAKEVITEASKYCREHNAASLVMLRDALLAEEHFEEEPVIEKRIAKKAVSRKAVSKKATSKNPVPTRVQLKEEDDFLAYQENIHSKSEGAQISWQALATNVLFRLTIKQLMAHMNMDAVKHVKKLTFLMNKIPDGIDAEEVEFDEFRALWLRPEGQKATTKTILYLPGGGFIFPASSGHTSIVSSLVEKTQSQGLIVHYRLAPEHPFPAGLEDTLSAYRYLLDQGISANDIVVAGDSAGGGLTLSLLLAIRDEGLPTPKAAAVISPLADLSFSGPSRDFNRWRDPMLPTSRKMKAFDHYSNETPAAFPLLSPVFGDLSGLPPLFAQVGSTEILLDDTLRIAQRARKQGVDVEVEVWDSLPHVWHLWSYIPESDQALTRIAEFFDRHFERANLQLVKAG